VWSSELAALHCGGGTRPKTSRALEMAQPGLLPSLFYDLETYIPTSLPAAAAVDRPVMDAHSRTVSRGAGASQGQPRALMRVATRTYKDFVWSLSFGLVTVASVSGSCASSQRRSAQLRGRSSSGTAPPKR
jgi:hypothetical protein